MLIGKDMWQRGAKEESKWFNEKWPLKDKDAESWKNLKPMTDEEINQLVADGVQTFKLLEFEVRAWSEKIVPLTTPGKPNTQLVASPVFGSSQECLFWAANGIAQVEIQYKRHDAPSKDRHVALAITGPNGKTVLRMNLEGFGAWHPLAIPTPAEGLYQMHLSIPKNSVINLNVPSNLPFVIKGRFYSASLSQRIYFFVPEGLKRFVFYSNGVLPFTLFDPDGIKTKEKVNGFIAQDVPSGMDGRVWAFDGFKGNFNQYPGMINIPAMFALSPEGMMVPEELVPKR